MRYMGRSICRRVVELTQQRREFNSLQRADSCFPTPLRTESLYTRILVGLKERFKAYVSNAFREIFQLHIAPLDERVEYIAYPQNWNNPSPTLVRDRRRVTDTSFSLLVRQRLHAQSDG